MVLFTEHIYRSSDKKMTTDVIYVDAEKAFDKPKFERIQQELKDAKIDGKLLNLIMFLLVNRKFLVKINGKLSSQTEADSGVGQGSVLGPIIFIILLSKLSRLLNNIDGIIHFIFADDLKLVYTYFIKDYDQSIMQNALATVSDWCSNESMAVAAHKTFHVQFGTPNPQAIYSLNNSEIQRKDMTRDLGFFIRNDGSISQHLNVITRNVNRKMFSILKKITIKDPKMLIYIYNTYIRPNYEYGSQIFNVQKKKYTDQLEGNQRLNP
uniref:Reverse transcriptase domain-containing protein n=1 Tax=Panagrolaimus superbus TaxID=310955 RepID=A0A914Z0R3_9BILA